MEDVLIPFVIDICSKNPSEKSKHKMLELCISHMKKFPEEKDELERTLK